MSGVADFVGDVVGDVAGGLFGVDAQQQASRDATQAQLQGIRESNQLQRDMFNAQAGLTEWQRGIGNQALGALGGLYGFQGGFNPAGSVSFDEDGKLVTTPATGGGMAGSMGRPDYSAFFNSPDFQFALEQGQRGLDANAAAGGNLFGGNRAREASRFNQGLATQQFGNFTNRLASLAGVGQTATNQLGNTLMNTGNQIGQGLQNMGNARGSGYINQANAQSNAVGNLFSLAGSAASAAAGVPTGFGGGGGTGGGPLNWSW